jgi:hypothetical protein
MEKASSQLLLGVDLTYSGPIVMSKAEINGSSIPLPKGVTYHKLREGDVYKVDRMLYSVLPDVDMRERFGTCAIVGNSGAMLSHEYGRQVDSHDLVYRFNQVGVWFKPLLTNIVNKIFKTPRSYCGFKP